LAYVSNITENSTIDGTPNDDVFIYRGGDEVIKGLAGDDLFAISSSATEGGTFRAVGGDGNDTLRVVSYRDLDVIYEAGNGDDIADLIYPGRDATYTLDMGDGNDTVLIGYTFDGTYISWGEFDITLGAGEDVVKMGRLVSGALLIRDFQPGLQGDTLVLDPGTFYLNWDGATNLFTTGHLQLVQDGNNTILRVDYDAHGSEAATDMVVFENTSLASFIAENFDGYGPDGSIADGRVVTGTVESDTVTGSFGADIIDGLGGGDFIDGGAGNDVLRGGDGDDRLVANYGNDSLFGGFGNDSLSYRAGNDLFEGGEGDDGIYVFSSIHGGSLFATGGQGADRLETLVYYDVDVTFEGGDGNDTAGLKLGTAASNFVLDMGAGDDLIEFGRSFSQVGNTYGQFDITLGAGQDNVIFYSFGYSSELTDDPLAYSSFSISDFEAGTDGDTLELLFSGSIFNWDQGDDPFATGAARLLQSGADTLLQFEQFGYRFENANIPTPSPIIAWTTVLTLEGVDTGSLSDFNFSGLIPNTAPSLNGVVSLDAVQENSSVTFDQADLLTLASDIDGNALSVSNVSVSSGQLTDNGNGSWTFLAGASIGLDPLQVSYEISDGLVSVDAIATLEVYKRLSVQGSDVDDVLMGGSGNDTLRGLGGSDTLNGGSGNDSLYGGSGADTLSGGAGEDYLYVDAEDFTSGSVNGGDGYDTAIAEDINGAGLLMQSAHMQEVERYLMTHSDDRIELQDSTANLTVYGYGGADIILTGSGDDYIYFDNEDIAGGGIRANGGYDWLLNNSSSSFTGTITVDMGVMQVEGYYGSNGTEIIDASQQGSSVTIYTNLGADQVTGGSGGDYIYVTSETVSFVGGAGFDYIIYNTFDGSGLTVDLTATGFEGAVGRGGNDSFDASGNTVSASLYGAGGNDILIGGTVTDYLYGDAGNDTYTGNGGTDYFLHDNTFGNDTITDFAIGTDVMIVRTAGVASMANMVITQDGADALLTMGANSIRLTGVTASSLTAADFIFAPTSAELPEDGPDTASSAQEKADISDAENVTLDDFSDLEPESTAKTELAALSNDATIALTAISAFNLDAYDDYMDSSFEGHQIFEAALF
jgi:Ca2+-binding RTX toxin-like protein